ncbi:hypothetical protein EDB89DRAFT_2071362 [Lactarius sanguifluus]|nr:hypothetical protein EDB89DRAFT_2071362 [Lactarius sanguifluus]
MPGFENEPLQPSSLLAELFGIDLPGVFQLQGLASPRLTAPPPGSIELGVGNYPPGMCGSSAFDDALCSLGEDPTTFMANPPADELLSAISILSPQENDDPLSSGSATTLPGIRWKCSHHSTSSRKESVRRHVRLLLTLCDQ